MPSRMLTVVGARPQFVKAMLLSELFSEERDIEEVVVHTGQHYDSQMSEVFFRELRMQAAKYQLGIHGGGHGEMTGRMLQALEPIAIQERPDAVLVYGDTNSTLAGALVGAKLCIPVIHVEAGLRSFNRCMAEETNRVLTDRVSRLLLCPTLLSVTNLVAEGIVHGVHHVGDIMYDVTLRMLPVARERSRILHRLGAVAEEVRRSDCPSRGEHGQRGGAAPGGGVLEIVRGGSAVGYSASPENSQSSRRA